MPWKTEPNRHATSNPYFCAVRIRTKVNMVGENGKAEEVKIKVPWGVVAVKCWNSPELEPVLMVHGLCENAGAFDRLVPLLSKDFYYACLDLAGHGWSSPFPPGLPLDFMAYVSQLQRVVNYFRWKKVTLVGHSLGGHLVETYAATFTGKVEKVILLDAISPFPVASDMFLVFHRNQMRQVFELEKRTSEPTVYTYDQALAQVASRRMSKLEPEAAKALLERSVRETERGFVFATDARARSAIRPAITEEVALQLLRRIKAPVLAVMAKNSEQFLLHSSVDFYAKVFDVLKKGNSLSSVIYVPGDHCVHNNQPEIIAPVINRFLVHQKSKI